MSPGRRFWILTAALLFAAIAAGPSMSQVRANWNDLGKEFCRQTMAGELEGIWPLLTRRLREDIGAASTNANLPSFKTLFQTYPNNVTSCSVRTRNVALVEIQRGDGSVQWTDLLVIAPEPDGTSRVDDVLFATPQSGTLRARLRYYAGR
mgnify:CR=1 FL=1